MAEGPRQIEGHSPGRSNELHRHPAECSGNELQQACEVRFQRRSGPGGQHRNKVETCVCLTHRATGVSAQAAERRQQAENLRVALERLRIQLALQVRCAWQAPSERWQRRCRGGQLQVSRAHDDYPALLAEAMDVLSGAGWRPAPAATQLGCTTSQLVRFLGREPSALVLVNRARAAAGLGTLK